MRDLAQLLREAANNMPQGWKIVSKLRKAVASLEAQEPVAWQLVDQPDHIEVEYREYHRGGEWEPLFRFPPTSAVPDGWKLVPVEPTQEMLDAAIQDGVCVDGKPVWKKDVVFQAKWKYQQMLAAAPQQEGQTVSDKYQGVECYQCGRLSTALSYRSRCLKCETERADGNAAENDMLRERLASAEADAERYRYIRKGGQWIVAATQTGAQLDGEELDGLIDSDIEEQK